MSSTDIKVTDRRNYFITPATPKGIIRNATGSTGNTGMKKENKLKKIGL